LFCCDVIDCHVSSCVFSDMLMFVLVLPDTGHLEWSDLLEMCYHNSMFFLGTVSLTH
jgi:hypothetical protein